MKRTFTQFTIGLACAAALAAASVASAQDQSQQNQSDKQERESRQSSEPTGAGQGGSEISGEELKVSDKDIKNQVNEVNKASKLIGMEVQNKQGERLGQIGDIVIDLDSGKVAYAVLSSGGLLGVGAKRVAVPLESFAAQQGEDYLVLDMEKQQIEQAAGFTENNWPDLDAAESGQTIGLARVEQEESEGMGGTADRTEQRAGTGSSSAGQSGDTITDLQQLRSASASAEGKQVRLSQARVDQMLGENLITISSGAGQPVLVKTSSRAQAQAGQNVEVTGTVKKMPSDPQQLGLDPSAMQQLQGQQFYIEAERVRSTQR